MAGGEAGVLVLGSGGRESALAQAMELSPDVGRVVVNASLEAGLAEFQDGPKPLIVVGPEKPLVEGVADQLREAGYKVFGAGAEAAQYEANKALTVEMLRRAGLPHPDTFISTDPEQDEDYITAHDATEFVIKANGLAGGKGVVLPATREEALEVARAMRGGAYDGAGKEIILFQERHSGPEISVMVVVGDNDEFFILPFSQDHKRLLDGDKGPNTGGMGAYAPLPESIAGPVQYQQIRDMVAGQLAQMRADGRPFERGLLYMGTMNSKQAGKIINIEDNVRFGDPETQVLMAILVAAGVDVYRLLKSAAEGKLQVPEVDIGKLAISALTVCLAAPGYPGTPRKGDYVYGLEVDRPNVTVHKAGIKDGKTDGGRVLYVTGVDETLPGAARVAYRAIDLNRIGPESERIGFAGMQLRRDIAHQAIQAA